MPPVTRGGDTFPPHPSFAVQSISQEQVQMQLGKMLIPRREVRRMGELISDATVQQRRPGVCAGRAVLSACPAAAWRERDTAQEERPEHCLWQHSLPLSCSLIILQFLCSCVMQCKFLEAVVPAMKDQLVVISGELSSCSQLSHPGVVYIMSMDWGFIFPSRVLRYWKMVMQ